MYLSNSKSTAFVLRGAIELSSLSRCLNSVLLNVKILKFAMFQLKLSTALKDFKILHVYTLYVYATLKQGCQSAHYTAQRNVYKCDQTFDFLTTCSSTYTVHTYIHVQCTCMYVPLYYMYIALQLYTCTYIQCTCTCTLYV